MLHFLDFSNLETQLYWICYVVTEHEVEITWQVHAAYVHYSVTEQLIHITW